MTANAYMFELFLSLFFFSVSPRLFLKETMRPFYKFHIPFSLRRSAHTYQSYSNFPPAGVIPSAAGWEPPPPYVHTHTHTHYHHHHPDSLQPRRARLIKECLPLLTALSFFLSFLFYILHLSSSPLPDMARIHTVGPAVSQRYGNRHVLETAPPPPKKTSIVWSPGAVMETLNKVLRFNWTFSDVGPIPLGINRFNIM